MAEVKQISKWVPKWDWAREESAIYPYPAACDDTAALELQ